MGKYNVVVLHILVTCAKSYGRAYGPTCAYGPDMGGDAIAKKVRKVHLGNETQAIIRDKATKKTGRVCQVPRELAQAGKLPGVMTEVQPGS